MNTTNLTRFQVYLEPRDVRAVDELARRRKISRSQVIRETIKQVSKKLSRAKPRGRNPLLDLVGIEKSRTGTIGLGVDEIYLHD